jgi:hypothetical protein
MDSGTQRTSSKAFSEFPSERDGLALEAVIRNTGGRPGKVVVQYYIERLSPSAVSRPLRWLGAFETARIAAGRRLSSRPFFRGDASRIGQAAGTWRPVTIRVTAAQSVHTDGPEIESVTEGPLGTSAHAGVER